MHVLPEGAPGRLHRALWGGWWGAGGWLQGLREQGARVGGSLHGSPHPTSSQKEPKVSTERGWPVPGLSSPPRRRRHPWGAQSQKP